MKSYKELESQYSKIWSELETLFGCSYDSEFMDFLNELMTFADWANKVVEESKVPGVYDAVMHERDKAELKEAKLEIKRLSKLQDIAIALKYMQDVYKIETENVSYFGENVRRQADSQLRDQVKYFLDTFKEKQDEHL